MSTVAYTQPRPLPTQGASARALLACGLLAGPLFVGGSLLNGLTRNGFDFTRHGISMLLLGGPGWIQVAIFELAGLLAIAAAVGARHSLHPGPARTWGPLLIGGYGLGIVIAGLFSPNPAFGFPPGTPDAMPSGMSGNASMHALGFFLSTISLIAGSFVFARRFMVLGHRAWAVYSAVTGLATPTLIAASIVMAPRGGIALLGVLLTTGGWIAAVSAKLIGRLTPPPAEAGPRYRQAQCDGRAPA
jgi:hypothetical protein